MYFLSRSCFESKEFINMYYKYYQKIFFTRAIFLAGTVPKNLAAKYPNINVEKTHNKIKLRKSSERIKSLPQKSLNHPQKIDRMFKQNEKIKTSIIQHLPNVEIVSILQDNNLLNTRVNINTR